MCAQVSVTVADVNAPPAWVISTTSASVRENSPVGTVITTVVCTDANVFQDHTFTVLSPWDAYFKLQAIVPAKHGLVPVSLPVPYILPDDMKPTRNNSEYFIRSALLVVNLDALDYEDMADANHTYTFQVQVTDDGTLTNSLRESKQSLVYLTGLYTGTSTNTPLSAVTSMTVRVLDVPDVPAIDTVVQVQAFGLSTAGGEEITLKGRNFGSQYPARPANAPSFPPYYPPVVFAVAAFYYNAEINLTASACSVVESYKVVQCKSVAGFGTGHTWKVGVGRMLSAASENTTFYAAPNVVRFATDYEGLSAGFEHGLSSGNQTIYISGTQFGLVTHSSVAVRRVTYGPVGTEYVAQDCRVVVDHTRIQCTTVPSVGGGQRWIVNIGGQKSETPTTSTTAPAITSVVLNGPMNTDGGTEVFIIGENFGAVHDPAYLGFNYDQVDSVTYGVYESSTSWVRSYNAVGCRVNVSYTVVRCLTAGGAGTNLRWAISIAGLSSTTSSVTTSYEPPVAIAVVIDSGVGKPTAGGVRATLSGHNFGGPADLQVIHFDGVVILNPSFISEASFQFTVPAGGGSHHNVSITVRGQLSNNATFAYDAPALPATGALKYISGSYGGDIRISVTGTSFGLCCFLASRNLGSGRLCLCQGGPTVILLMSTEGVTSECRCGC